jgi:hypothetical protein
MDDLVRTWADEVCHAAKVFEMTRTIFGDWRNCVFSNGSESQLHLYADVRMQGSRAQAGRLKEDGAGDA